MVDRIPSPDWQPGPEDTKDLDRVTKRCPICRKAWEGWTWKQGLAPLPHLTPRHDTDGMEVAKCPGCLDIEEATREAEDRKGREPVGEVELTRPERAGRYGDD